MALLTGPTASDIGNASVGTKPEVTPEVEITLNETYREAISKLPHVRHDYPNRHYDIDRHQPTWGSTSELKISSDLVTDV